jgi:hypothetical protein
MSAVDPVGYRSAGTLALWASIVLVAHALAAALTAFASAYQVQLFDTLIYGGSVPVALAEIQDRPAC